MKLNRCARKMLFFHFFNEKIGKNQKAVLVPSSPNSVTILLYCLALGDLEELNKNHNCLTCLSGNRNYSRPQAPHRQVFLYQSTIDVKSQAYTLLFEVYMLVSR